MKINFFSLDAMSDADRRALCRRSESDISSLADTVSPIIDAVKSTGDEALFKYTLEFDGADLRGKGLRVSESEIESAIGSLDTAIKAAIDYSAANIRRYHQAQMPEEMWFVEVAPGILAGEKITPITSVGVYVPSGKGSFPSVMLMLGIPAQIAGVPRVAVCTPPRPDGTVDPATLYAARICGLSDVYRVGGAQAIAALAYGTESIPRVAKTLGPGNSYVSAAKRMLYGVVDPGTPAGPSESIILCDGNVDPRIAGLDLLIEAEHGPDSTALLVTHDRKVADAVAGLLPDLVAKLPARRREFCETVFSGYGGIVLTPSLEASLGFVNEFAPEHLEVLVDDPMSILGEIKNAGEILLGKYTPITVGNFSLGVNAILPTGGFARSFSAVTVHDYLKRSSIGYVSQQGYPGISAIAQGFAEYEGFAAHAMAIRDRNLGRA
jgi:histidinol dehydrogenase